MKNKIKSLKNFLYKYYLGKSIIGLISNIRFLLNIFFFKLNKFLRICFGNQKYEKLTKLKNKYINERCFIVATGPSMKMKYLKYLKNEYTFSMNNITKYYAKTKWRPTFYVIQDLEALEEKIKYYIHIIMVYIVPGWIKSLLQINLAKMHQLKFLMDIQLPIQLYRLLII